MTRFCWLWSKIAFLQIIILKSYGQNDDIYKWLIITTDMWSNQMDGCERKFYELAQRKLISGEELRYLDEYISDETRKTISNCKKPHEVLAKILLASISECNDLKCTVDERISINLNDESFSNEFIKRINQENRKYQPNSLHNSRNV